MLDLAGRVRVGSGLGLVRLCGDWPCDGWDASGCKHAVVNSRCRWRPLLRRTFSDDVCGRHSSFKWPVADNLLLHTPFPFDYLGNLWSAPPADTTGLLFVMLFLLQSLRTRPSGRAHSTPMPHCCRRSRSSTRLRRWACLNHLFESIGISACACVLAHCASLSSDLSCSDRLQACGHRQSTTNHQ